MSSYEDMTEEELDEYVHELKGAEAAAINNAGKEAQLSYLNGAEKKPDRPCSAATANRFRPEMASVVGNRVYMTQLVCGLKKLSEAEARDFLTFVQQCGEAVRAKVSEVRRQPWKYMP